VQSPEVLPDGRVTFRLHAPRATEVTIAGEWTRAGGAPNAPERMSKDARGIWSITVGPLEPNIYIYVFNVDGMTITDPINPSIKLRARTSASMVEIPGEAAATPWQMRDVPHGAVTIETHTSKVLQGAARQILVYTPPGYDRTTRYPILYLFHGNNDLELGWTMAGRAHLILDNLIADKRAVPMIIAMPWGHALPFGARPAAGQPSNNDLFERYLLEEVMPFVEGKYRTRTATHAPATDRRNRAIVGLSMGGAQALQIGLGHRDRFATIGIFGAGLPRADFEIRDRATADQAAKFPMALVYLGIGKEDGGLTRARDLSAALTEHNFPLITREVEGGHTYPTWRKLLANLVPHLFHPTPAHPTPAKPPAAEPSATKPSAK
jgi:enterochelin esterase-like enzyme